MADDGEVLCAAVGECSQNGNQADAKHGQRRLLGKKQRTLYGVQKSRTTWSKWGRNWRTKCEWLGDRGRCGSRKECFNLNETRRHLKGKTSSKLKEGIVSTRHTHGTIGKYISLYFSDMDSPIDQRCNWYVESEYILWFWDIPPQNKR